MRLVSVERSESPLLPAAIRVAGTAQFDNGETQTIWFDVPSEHAPAINDQGDAWAVLLLPDAIVRRENLVLDVPVDPVLLDNLRGLQRLWQAWYSFVHPVEIQAPAARLEQVGRETAQFFSGGVDSYFTLLYGLEQQEYPGIQPTSCLLTLWGFDISIDNPDAFAAVRGLSEKTAEQFGLESIPIATNALALSCNKRYLGRLTQGGVIAASGLLLSKRFENLLIAGSFDVGATFPWGSHPLVEPLYSTSQTRVIHHGQAFGRIEKTTLVARSSDALSQLRVCWSNRDHSNCSRCSKCIRTMVTLDLLGAKDRATSFDWTDYSLANIAKTYVPSRAHADLIAEIRDMARERSRHDLVQALDRCLRRSILLRYSVVGFARFAWSKMKAVPWLRRAATPLYGTLKRLLMKSETGGRKKIAPDT